MWGRPHNNILNLETVVGRKKMCKLGVAMTKGKSCKDVVKDGMKFREQTAQLPFLCFWESKTGSSTSELSVPLRAQGLKRKWFLPPWVADWFRCQ